MQHERFSMPKGTVSVRLDEQTHGDSGENITAIGTRKSRKRVQTLRRPRVKR